MQTVFETTSEKPPAVRSEDFRLGSFAAASEGPFRLITVYPARSFRKQITKVVEIKLKRVKRSSKNMKEKKTQCMCTKRDVGEKSRNERNCRVKAREPELGIVFIRPPRQAAQAPVRVEAEAEGGGRRQAGEARRGGRGSQEEGGLQEEEVSLRRPRTDQP